VSPAQQIYSAEFDRRFFTLPPAIREQIQAKIDELGLRLQSFPHHRMKGCETFRLRAGDYRVIYQFNAARGQIFLITLGHRREIYR
jgi:mRNA-degrading endonuclease RelE of RelBE toxin-antitoxin system